LPQIWKIDGASGDIVDGSLLHVHRGHYPIAVMGSRLWYGVSTGHHKFTGNPGGAGQGLALVGHGIYDVSKVRIPLGRAQSIDDLIVGGRYLWLADSPDQVVYRIDTDASTYRRFPIYQEVDRLSFGDGRLWILDTRTGSLRAMRPNGRIIRQLPVPGDLTDMTVGGGSVMITDAAGDQIQRIPEDLSRGGVPIPLAGVGNGPSVVDYLSTGAVAVGFDDGTVAAFNPTSGAQLWKNVTGVTPNAMTSGYGKVWVVGVPVPAE
jgi:outer membrane protein assembly factor BamB